MCDPVSISLATTAIGAAGSVASSMSAASAQKRQAREVANWQAEQSRFRKQEAARQEEFRQKADAERQAGLADIGAEGQKKRQSEEEARLAATLQTDVPQPGDAPVSEADKALAYGRETENVDLKSDFAKKINDVTKEAKNRVAALARIGSFGQSFGGLGTTNPLLQQATGNAIDQQNEFRRGSLGAFGTERAIDPVQVTASPSPLGDISSALLSFGTQGLGNATAKGGGWGSLFNTTKLPATAPVPTPAFRLPGTAPTPTSRPIF